jgi:hypothetical protein
MKLPAISLAAHGAAFSAARQYSTKAVSNQLSALSFFLEHKAES